IVRISGYLKSSELKITKYICTFFNQVIKELSGDTEEKKFSTTQIVPTICYLPLEFESNIHVRQLDGNCEVKNMKIRITLMSSACDA
ncbi:hypothetical protein Tco_0783135, partial [Tanacetum coccineum]